MKRRIARSMLVMFVAVTLASVLQELVPPVPPFSVKAPWLLAVCVYYAVRREWVWSVTAAVWCGMMQDGLGGIPYGISLVVFCLIACLCVFFVKKQMPDNTVTCMIVSVAGGIIVESCQYVMLLMSGAYVALPTVYLLGRLLIFIVLCLPVAAVVAGIVRLLDVVSGNVGFENENKTFGWNAC